MHGLGARQGVCGARGSLGHSGSGLSLPGRVCQAVIPPSTKRLLFALTGLLCKHAGASSTRRQRVVNVRAETESLSPLDVLRRENELLKQVRFPFRKLYSDLGVR